MTLNFSTFQMSGQMDLSDFNKQNVIYQPDFSAQDFPTLEADLQLTANLVADISGLRFESITLRKKYTNLHSPVLSPNANVERMGMIVCEVDPAGDDYYILQIPSPIDSIVLPDQTINLSKTEVLAYANIFRTNAYGINNSVLAESSGNTSMITSLRVPVLLARKAQKAIG